MTMLPQPPPDAPAPPPSEEALRSRRWWRWIWVTGAISIAVFLLFILSVPVIFRGRHRGADLIEAKNNARMIGLDMMEFQNEYGNFPDATTIAAVQAATGNMVPPGTKTSNDFFRQLFAAEMTQSERMFFARIGGTRKSDGLTAGIHFLEKGECGFTYFLGAFAYGNPKRPLLVTSMIPGTDRFDPKPLQGKAVILHIDNTVTTLPTDKAGHVLVDGRNLMDPHHPIWDGHAPVIAWPDL